MQLWLDGFEKVAGNDAGPFLGGVPMRLVLHTTEGSSVDGALAAFRANNTWPHFTIDAGRKRRVQHLPLDHAGRALKNLAGGVETNREGAIQIEIVGFAASTQDMTDDALSWMATQVVAPILAATGITTNHPAFVGTEAGTIATPTAKQRFTFAAWQAFNGICGHQHVPENDHWDPGHFPIDRLISFLQEDDVTDKDKQDIINAVNAHVDARVNQAAGDLLASVVSHIEGLVKAVAPPKA